MRKIKNISAILLATSFLLAGNGVNLIEYCCNQCKDRGTKVLTEGCHESKLLSCCSAHSSDEAAESCDDLAVTTAHKCHVKRYTLDDGQELSTKISLQITVTAAALPPFATGITSPSTSITLNKNFPSIGYVHDSGRSLLSHNCVLTI